MKLVIRSTRYDYDVSCYKGVLKHYNLEGPISKSGYLSRYYTIDIQNIENLYKLSDELGQELIVTVDLDSPNPSIDKALEIYDDYRE